MNDASVMSRVSGERLFRHCRGSCVHVRKTRPAARLHSAAAARLKVGCGWGYMLAPLPRLKNSLRVL
jgi:hypothetical protein